MYQTQLGYKKVFTFDICHNVPAGDLYGCSALCDLDLLYHGTCHPAIPVDYSGPTLLENSSSFPVGYSGPILLDNPGLYPVEDGDPSLVGNTGCSDHNIAHVLFHTLSCLDLATFGYFPCFVLYDPPVISNIFGYIAVITVRMECFHYALLHTCILCPEIRGKFTLWANSL